MRLLQTLLLVGLLNMTSSLAVAQDGQQETDAWPQAAGPNQNWTVQTEKAVPTEWSVSENKNIRWKKTLPETGQSGIAVWGNRLFLTTMKPLTAEAAAKSKKGTDIVLYCLDADSGDTIWEKELAGDPKALSMYAYGFSSASSPTPITDGKHVWFWNASGQMGCWTMDGEEVWTRRWTPTLKRPFNKQFEPIKIGDTILNMEPRATDDPLRREDAWNYLKGFSAVDGRELWIAPEGLTHYNTPVMGKLPGGGHAVLSGRGAHHKVPESPPGLTLTHLDGPEAGKTVWSWRATPKGKTMVTQCWDEQYSYWLDESRTDLIVLNTKDGSEEKTISWVKNVTVTSYDPETKTFETREGVNLNEGESSLTVFPAWYANLSVHPYLYFQCFNFKGKFQRKDANIGPRNSIVRINVETGKVEFLELPFETPEVPDQQAKGGQMFYPSMTLNSRGIDVAQDKRTGRTGWWWCFNGNTIAVNQYLYFTFMCGKVQVIDGKADKFDQSALVSMNDLGKFGETWSVNTPSYSNGRIYHRTMKELICIEQE